MNFNRATLVGRLTRDPEARSLPSGQTVVNFGLATSRFWTDQQSGTKQEATDFHNIVAFGKLGEICSQYLKKGSLILIEGRLHTSSWEGQDGFKRYRTEIVAQTMQMGPRSGQPGAAAATSAPRVNVARQAAPAATPEEDIPVIDAEEEAGKESEPDAASGETETIEPTAKESTEGEVDVNNIPF